MTTLFIGVDIGSTTHRYCLFNEDAQVVKQGNVRQSIRAIAEWLKEIKSYGAQSILVGMEGSNGYASPMDRMMADAGFEVHAIKPISLEQFRKLVGQARKDDVYDAYLIGKYLLEIHPKQKRQALGNPGQSSMGNLRVFTRQLRTTKRDITRAIQRLQKHLLGYFPDFYEVFDDLQGMTARVLLKHYGSISKIKRARETTIAKTPLINSKRRVGPKAAAKLKAIANEISYVDSLEDSLEQVTQVLLEQVNFLIDKREALENKIENLIAQFPVIEQIAQKIPGAGLQSTAELLGEIGDIRRFSNRDKLTLYCGIGALNHSSGKSIGSKKSTQVNHRTKGVICMMAQAAIIHDTRSRVYYDKKRQEGKSHWHAIKCLSKYLLRNIFKILNTMKNTENLNTCSHAAA